MEGFFKKRSADSGGATSHMQPVLEKETVWQCVKDMSLRAGFAEVHILQVAAELGVVPLLLRQTLAAMVGDGRIECRGEYVRAVGKRLSKMEVWEALRSLP